MPGLFDDTSAPSFGGILQGVGAALSPQFFDQRMQLRLMQNQYNGLMQQPGMTPDRAISIITNPGGPAAATQYGMHQFEGPTYSPDAYKPPGPIYQGGQIINQPGMAPNASMQPQPSQQPAGGGAPGIPQDVQQAAPIMDFLAQQKAKALAAAKAAEQTATAQPDLPVLQTRAGEVIRKLQAIKNNPELPNVIGGFVGVKGRLGPLGPGQAGVLSDIDDANNALQGDLFTNMRNVSGRGISPGAMKEMRITDLTQRKMGLGQYKANLDSTIKQIQDEYGAAWEARGKPDAYKPNWGQSQPAQSAGPKRITNEQDYAQVKSGEHYTDPTGVLRVKR